MFAHAVWTHPDELDTSFYARYGRSWRGLPVWQAAVLAWPLATRPEYDLCRVYDPQWAWRDPLFNVVASALGCEPDTRDDTRARDSDVVSRDWETLNALLSARRE